MPAMALRARESKAPGNSSGTRRCTCLPEISIRWSRTGAILRWVSWRRSSTAEVGHAGDVGADGPLRTGRPWDGHTRAGVGRHGQTGAVVGARARRAPLVGLAELRPREATAHSAARVGADEACAACLTSPLSRVAGPSM